MKGGLEAPYQGSNLTPPASGAILMSLQLLLQYQLPPASSDRWFKLSLTLARKLQGGRNPTAQNFQKKQCSSRIRLEGPRIFSALPNNLSFSSLTLHGVRLLSHVCHPLAEHPLQTSARQGFAPLSFVSYLPATMRAPLKCRPGPLPSVSGNPKFSPSSHVVFFFFCQKTTTSLNLMAPTLWLGP